MKKTALFQGLTSLLLLSMLTACAQEPAKPPSGDAASSVSTVLEQKTGIPSAPSDSTATPDPEPSGIPEPTPPPKPTQPNDRLKTDGTYDKIDLDLSSFSETLTYAELTNMALMPEDYEGKVVKINGLFSHYVQPKTKQTHHMLFLMDATACCGQVLDFILHDPNAHPENEIPENSEITVTGLFEIYEENADFGIASYRLIDAYIS